MLVPKLKRSEKCSSFQAEKGNLHEMKNSMADLVVTEISCVRYFCEIKTPFESVLVNALFEANPIYYEQNYMLLICGFVKVTECSFCEKITLKSIKCPPLQFLKVAFFVPSKNILHITFQYFIWQSPLSAVSPSEVLVTCGQSGSRNFKWKIKEINHS